MSAKADFSTLLSEDENVVLVGDLLYARIRGDQDFKITSCHVMDANHISGSQHKLVQYTQYINIIYSFISSL